MAAHVSKVRTINHCGTSPSRDLRSQQGTLRGRLQITGVTFMTKSAWIPVLSLVCNMASRADHMDSPSSVGGGVLNNSADAQIADFYSFISGNKLVPALNVNPFLDPAIQSYRFPTDVSYKINVDLNSV